METGPRFIVPSDGMEKPGIEPATLVYKASVFTTAPRRLLKSCSEIALWLSSYFGKTWNEIGYTVNEVISVFKANVILVKGNFPKAEYRVNVLRTNGPLVC